MRLSGPPRRITVDRGVSMPSTVRHAFLLATACVGGAAVMASGHEPLGAPLLTITLTVDFGPDLGQNFGTLFEVTDASGRPIAGAGFPGLYNTTSRADRRALQCYVRPPDGGGTPHCETLPRFGADTGVAIGDLDGRLYATGHRVDSRAHEWDPDDRTWRLSTRFGSGGLRHGDGAMALGDGRLSFRDDRVTFDGAEVLAAPAGEHIHHVYYALGHLFFFHDRPGDADAGGFTRIAAIPWKPGDTTPLDIGRAVVFPTNVPHETTWSWGQLRGTVLTVTNRGTVLAFDGRAWRTLREQDGRSFQVYSMLTVGDRLLLGQYPDGSVHEFDGESLLRRERRPPPMPGVVAYAREAQSMAIYRGDLYVGVWPWAEVWRLDRHRDEWSLVRRLFDRPDPSDAVGHPFEGEIVAANAAHGTKRVINEWGQRVSGLTAVGAALFMATSNKGGLPRLADDTFLDDDTLAQYGTIHRLVLPGHLSVPSRWAADPIRYEFVFSADRLRVVENGRELGSAPVDPAASRALGEATVAWGRGVFGPLAGTLLTRATE